MKYGINQGHLQEKLDLQNFSERTQYYSNEFEKMRCEIQECGNYQPCRVFIQNILAVQLTMTAKKNTSSYLQGTIWS